MIIFINASLTFFDPTLSIYLDEFYDENAEYSGFILSLKEFIYICFCPLCTKILIKTKNPRILVYFGAICLVSSMLLFGPDEILLKLPKKVFFPILASFIQGVGVCFTFLPII
jgi:hypothetical protein